MIFGRKRKLIKNCTLYISEKHNHLIVVPRFENQDGLNIEQANTFSHDLTISNHDLGQEIVNALNAYKYEKFTVKGMKKSDWAAFNASKCKSIRSFQNDYFYFNISNQNEGNIIINIEARPNQNSLFWVKSSISFYAEKTEIGRQILETFEICKSGNLLK